MRRCFEPSTREKANGEYRLLICDGHDSHITGEFFSHCMEHKIILMILPPHSSHMTQPLDVGVFGPLKKHMATEIDPLIRTGIPRVQKVEWLTAFVAAHDKALSSHNILGGFCGTGIHPFNPDKVLGHVDTTPDPEPPQPTTPGNSTTPFNESVLTSSPLDMNAVHRANIALCAELDSGLPLSSPAKKFIKCQGRSHERLYASNSILKHENEAKDAVIRSRKRALSGKRKSIDGKHVMTVDELHGIQEAEAVTKKRRASSRMATRGRKPKQNRKKQSIELEEEFSSTSDEAELQIFDCITVEI